MGRVKVLIMDKQTEVKIPTGIRLLIRRACNAVVVFEKFDGRGEVSISFVNNEEIQKLNKMYRHLDMPTDVLSFPLCEDGNFETNEDGVVQFGDIVISVEKAVEQAYLYSHSLQREIAYLTVHAMLHLFGYDHTDGLETTLMREKEEKVLISLGLSRNLTLKAENESIS